MDLRRPWTVVHDRPGDSALGSGVRHLVPDPDFDGRLLLDDDLFHHHWNRRHTNSQHFGVGSLRPYVCHGPRFALRLLALGVRSLQCWRSNGYSYSNQYSDRANRYADADQHTYTNAHEYPVWCQRPALLQQAGDRLDFTE